MKYTLLCLFCAAAWAANVPTGGNGTLYIGGRPGRILVIDEATEKVVGEIKTKTNAPEGLELSEDKKLFYVTGQSLEDIEIIDIAARKEIDAFTLSSGNKKVRLFGMAADPSNSYMILLTKSYTKMLDHWEIGAPTLQLYDLKQHKVTRDIPWPDGEEKEFANLKFSPDGKFVYLFGEDIIALDTKEFKQVDKWELSRPLEDGFGRINLQALDDNYEDPGFFTGIFQVQDDVQHRRIMGIARVNLSAKSVDFYALGPATGVSFSLSPDRKFGYGLHQEIGKYEFWSFDLANKKLGPRQEFEGRPRMSLKTSSNGKLLYIFTASAAIDIYDASTYKFLRSIDLAMDETTQLMVMPRK